MGTDTARALGSPPVRHTIDGRPGRPVDTGTASIMGGANLAVRVCVELGAYASLSFWGASLTAWPAANVSLAIVAPLAAILVWVRYLAPKARRPLHDPGALVAELAVFAGSALALAVSGPVALAIAFAAVAIANTFLIRILGRHHLDVAQ
ncbi:MAG: YrdB family protein [Acidimicrobiales bacterium]|jgi:hypothetical protein